MEIQFYLQGLFGGGIHLNYTMQSVLKFVNSYIPTPHPNIINNQNFCQPTFSHKREPKITPQRPQIMQNSELRSQIEIKVLDQDHFLSQYSKRTTRTEKNLNYPQRKC